jgi:hypothetical protein
MNTSVLVVAVLVTGAIGPAIACLRVRDSPLSFHLAFQAILFVAYVVKAALVIDNPTDFVTYPYAWTGPYIWMSSVLVASVGSMALSAGYVTMAHRLDRLERPEPRSLASYRPASAVMFVGALMAYLLLCNAAGLAPISPNFYSPLRRTAFLYALSGNGHLNVALLMMPVLAAPLLATGRIVIRTGVLAVCLMVLGGVGNRTSLTGVLLIYLFGLLPGLVGAGWRRLTPMLGTLVAVTMVMGYRIQGQTGGNPIDILKRYSLGFDGYDNISGVLQVDDHTRRYYGATLLDDVIYAFVPRGIFPGKADYYGNTLLQQEIFPAQGTAFGTRASFPVSLYGEGQLSFGLIGVLLFGAVAGMIAAFGNRLMGYVRSGGLTLQQTTALFLLGAAINLYRSLGMYLQLLFLAGVICGLLELLRRFVEWFSPWVFSERRAIVVDS